MGRTGGVSGGAAGGDVGGTTQATPRTIGRGKAAAAKKKVKPPPLNGPLYLNFTDVSEEDLAEIAAVKTKEEVRRLLQKCLDIDQPEGFRTEALCDLHYHNYAFCVSRSFSAEKISTFLSILKRVLEEAVERKLPVEEAFDVFKDWLLKHSVERPPRSKGVFTFEDVQAIMDHVHNTFFRHYKLYMYVYMTRCDIDFRVDRRRPAIAPPPRSLTLDAEREEDPRTQPEFAHIFAPTKEELEEAERRRMADPAGEKERDRATLIKQKVEEGMKKLMDNFEQQVKQQDERFKTMLEAK
eukprot:TRINITY_DN34846_c0_g1_i1.p1 TRINITY_DN34846_c0_g1~~TRINITY_DN34846_c0_g1_i1.p1  ORF type:complete len:296 (+),score=72.14 TRINITY_DN34846_c0_g1_i1:149-1036(+)